MRIAGTTIMLLLVLSVVLGLAAPKIDINWSPPASTSGDQCPVSETFPETMLRQLAEQQKQRIGQSQPFDIRLSSWISKAFAADPTRVGNLTLESGEDVSCAVIDASTGFAYFGTYTSPGIVVKVRLSDFSRNASLTLESGEDDLDSAVIDVSGGFAYFGTWVYGTTGIVVKVRLSDLSRNASLTLESGEEELDCAVIDASAGFAYFGTFGPFMSPSIVVKVRLSDLSRNASLTLESGEEGLGSAVIDASAGFAYFGTGTSPGIVVKVRLSDFSRNASLTLESGENELTSAVVDASAGFAYFGTYTSPGIVVKVRLRSPPTNDGLSLYAGSIASGIVGANKQFTIRSQHTDADGATDINYVEITVDVGGWAAMFRWTESTDTFSEEADPNSYFTLSSTSDDSSSAGNQWTLDWKLTVTDWTTDESNKNIRAYAIDDSSLTDQDDYTSIFRVENDLTSASLAVDDYHVNPSQTLTFTGSWFYDGTAVAPPDGDYQVVIKLAGSQKGSTDTTLVSGAFSINDVTAAASVDSYDYTVEASYMTAASGFSSVVVDKLKVSSYTVADTRVNINENVNIDATLVYESDSSAVTTGTITINTYSASHQGSGVYRITRTSSSPTSVTYDTVAGSETAYGLDTVNQNGQSVTVTWDELTIAHLKITTVGGGSNLTAIDPYTYYEFQVNVTDTGTMNNVYNVTIRVEQNPSAAIESDTPSYVEESKYWFRYDNDTNSWEWYSGSAWTSTSNWLDAANCSKPSSSATQGYFKFKIRLSKVAATGTNWDFDAIVHDLQIGATATKKFDAFTVNAYIEYSLSTSEITWNVNPGDTNTTATSTLTITVTTNTVVKIQIDGNGDLTRVGGSDTIPLANVVVDDDSDPGTDARCLKLTQSYQDWWISIPAGANQEHTMYWFLSVPSPSPTGTYVFTFYIAVSE